MKKELINIIITKIIIIGLIIIAIIILLQSKNFSFNKNKEIIDSNIKIEKFVDSLNKEKLLQDSLLNVISLYEDSLLLKKDSAINKIVIKYEKDVNIIDTLSVDDNIELLSKNLSKEDIN